MRHQAPERAGGGAWRAEQLTMRRFSPLIAILTLATVAAAVVAMLLVGSPASSASTSRERTAVATHGVVQKTVSGSGTLEPQKQYELSFGASGDVTNVYVQAGQKVVEGQALARIDPSTANADLAQAQADLQSADDTLTQADQPQTNTTASGKSSPSTSATTGPSVSVATAQAQVTSAQLAVTKAEKEVAATKIVAPAAGTVAAVNGAVGDAVSAGSSGSSASSSSSSSGGSSGVSTPSVATGLGGGSTSTSSTSSSASSSGFITLVDVHRFKMDVSLSESDIASVKVGQSATVTVNAAAGDEFAARVSSIGVLPSSSGSSSAVSYPVTLTLEQSSRTLKAGMSATADIVTAQTSGITIPTQALTGSAVTVETSDGKRTTKTVQAGLTGDSSVLILSGLNAGEKVVIRAPAITPSTTTSGATTPGAGGFGGRFGGGGVGGGGVGGGPRLGSGRAG